jgi:hypothetical protein
VNPATMGHKLQGKMIKSLVIAQWSKVKNWAYVILSHVKTLDGPFLMNTKTRRYRFFTSKSLFGHDGKFKDNDTSNP